MFVKRNLQTTAFLYDFTLTGGAIGFQNSGLQIPKFSPIIYIGFHVLISLTSATNVTILQIGAGDGLSITTLLTTLALGGAPKAPGVYGSILNSPGNTMGTNIVITLNITGEAYTAGKMIGYIMYGGVQPTATGT